MPDTLCCQFNESRQWLPEFPLSQKAEWITNSPGREANKHTNKLHSVGESLAIKRESLWCPPDRKCVGHGPNVQSRPAKPTTSSGTTAGQNCQTWRKHSAGKQTFNLEWVKSQTKDAVKVLMKLLQKYNQMNLGIKKRAVMKGYERWREKTGRKNPGQRSRGVPPWNTAALIDCLEQSWPANGPCVALRLYLGSIWSWAP